VSDPLLRIETARRRDHLLVRPDGEVDASTCGHLGEVLRTAAREEDGGDVVLDLSDVRFMDSSGLGVLLNAHRRLIRAQRRLHLVVPEGAVRKLLRQTDLDTTFAVHARRKDAERSVSG
jgi:anti-sigma B factor antagonist